MDITLDFDVYRWKLAERIAFEKAVGMTCERALSLFASAGENEEAALDVPASVQAAFVWIVARRQEPDLTFEQAAEQFDGMSFIDGIPEEEEPPLAPNRAQRRSTKKSSVPSASTSTTPRPKSST